MGKGNTIVEVESEHRFLKPLLLLAKVAVAAHEPEQLLVRVVPCHCYVLTRITETTTLQNFHFLLCINYYAWL